MLKCFEVEGFKNFDKKIGLVFSDVHDYKFNVECITNGLLSKIIVYGKNSVGKTNLGLAIFDIVSHLTDKNVTPDLYDYYLNANSSDSAKFRYIFQFHDDTIDYKYSKDKKRSLIYEEISINGELLLSYDYKKMKGDYKGLKSLNPSLVLDFENLESVLRYVIFNTKLKDTHPLRKMIKYVSSMLWFRNLDENRYIGYKSNTKDYLDFIFENNTLDEFQKFLYDAGIDDKLLVKTDTDGVKRLYLDSKIPIYLLQECHRPSAG